MPNKSTVREAKALTKQMKKDLMKIVSSNGFGSSAIEDYADIQHVLESYESKFLNVICQ
jgi:hypothetical protein